MSLVLFLVGCGIFCAMGLAHAMLALRDLFVPSSLTPRNDAVRKAMSEEPLRLAPQTTIWRSWLGFNLSHSLGLLVFGGLLSTLALSDFSLIRSSLFLQLMTLAVSLAYVALSLRFWFWVPAVASGVGFVCFLGSALT
jgi:hypothetical protein